MDASADADYRAERFPELLDNLFYLDHIALDCRLVGPHADCVGVGETGNLLCQYVVWDIDEDGTLSAAACDIEGLLHDAGDVGGVSHEIAVFYEGFGCTRDVSLLEDVASYHVG